MAERRRRGKRANGEGSVYQRGDTGQWVAQLPAGHYPNGNVKYRRQTVDTQREATELLREARNMRAEGRSLDAKVPTVAAYLDHWLATVVEPQREPKTYQSYLYAAGLIKPLLGRVRLDKLTPEQVEKALHDLRERGGEQGQGLSPQTVLHARATLRRALGRAVKHGTLVRNVASLVDPPAVKRAEVQPFTADEARALLDAADGERLEALYVVAVLVGLRQGELLGLRWRDVDLKDGTLRVRQQLQHIRGQKPRLKTLKTRASRRDLDLPDDALFALRALHDRRRLESKARGAAWDDDALVFPSAAGTPMFPRNLVRHYKGLLRRAGLPDRRFHDLRHTAATLMFARGLDPSDVQRILGHTSITITNDTYIHWLPDRKKRAAEAMSGFRAEGRERGA